MAAPRRRLTAQPLGNPAVWLGPDCLLSPARARRAVVASLVLAAVAADISGRVVIPRE